MLLLALGLSVALHLTPVLELGWAKPLVFALACLCFLSPVTGFFFIGASAILPTVDTEAYAAMREAFEAGDMSFQVVDSAAKFGFIAWAVVTPVRYRRLSLRGLTLLWPISPWLLWVMLTNGYGAVVMNMDYVKSVLYCVIACQLANESKGQHLKCLLGLCLGCLVVIMGFWANAAGLPVTLCDWGGERGGIARLGSVLADSVMPGRLCSPALPDCWDWSLAWDQN